MVDSWDVPLLPPQLGIFSLPIVTTGQLLHSFMHFAEVNLHQVTFTNSMSYTYLRHLFLFSPLPLHTKPDLFKDQDAVAWVTVGHQLGCTGVFWLPLLATPSFLKVSHLMPLGHASHLALSAFFSLFLFTLLALKCWCFLEIFSHYSTYISQDFLFLFILIPVPLRDF